MRQFAKYMLGAGALMLLTPSLAGAVTVDELAKTVEANAVQDSFVFNTLLF